MDEHGQIALRNRSPLHPGRRVSPIIGALLASGLFLLLTFLALNTVARGAAEDPIAKAAGASLVPTEPGIFGQVWYDADGDGLKDTGETGIPDSQMILILITDGTPIETTTDLNGYYQYTGLQTGQYVLWAVAPYLWVPTSPISQSYLFQFDGVNSIDGLDFGFQPINPGGFHGMKFNDLDSNGRKDPDEPGIPGWSIQLTNQDGLTMTTVTDIGGRYWFMGMPTGTYTISEVLQAGWTQTAPVLEGGINYYVNVHTPPQLIEHLDFGNHRDNFNGLHGIKWYDFDGNGQKDPGEPGIPGWQIELKNFLTPNVSLVAYTDERGQYSFFDLPSGGYTVTEVLQDGWQQTFPSSGYHQVEYDGINAIEGLNFGNKETNPGGIHGLKFNDRNGNGRRDDGEPGLSGWQINIADANTQGDTYSDTATTDADGRYWFLGLPAGRYLISETVQAGWQQTFPPFESYEIAFVPGQPVEGISFGNYRPEDGSIHGLNFHDINGNSRLDAGEPGLSGWKIRLQGESVAGLPVSRTATTDGAGRYSFMNMPPGFYLIVEEAQPDWFQTFPGTGFHTAVLGPGLTVAGLDFGNGQPFPGTIKGKKFHDLDGDGRLDGGETGLPGWVIVLQSSDGLSKTTTDSEGRYAFTGLLPGRYLLWEELQDGWQQTTSCTDPPPTISGPPKCEFEWGDSSFNAAIIFANNIGNWQPGPGGIRGLKFHDQNANGRRDQDEPGLAGWTIELRGHDILSQTTTNQDGSYWFMGLPPGNYQLREQPQAGWFQTFPMNNSGHSLRLEQGDQVSGLDFGNWDPQPSEIHGLKFNDLDGDGRQEPGEPGLPDWTIVLQGLYSRHEMKTGPTGVYSFTNLQPGPYIIREIIPDGWYPTTPKGGYTFVQLDYDQVARVSFGNVQASPGTIHGLKFNDLDGDGIKDGGEPGLPGWEIELRSIESVSIAITDADGHYAFTNLPPGEYFISEVQQPGWQQTTSCPSNAPAEGGTHTCHFIWESFLSFDAIINFGNWQPDAGGIHGNLWHDLDGDGVGDPGEPVIPNRDVVLVDDDGKEQTTQTDGKGKYWFMNLLPGKYRLRIRLPAGWQQTFPQTGDHTINLAPNQVVDGVDFGIWQPKPGSIHGQKFEDLDGDGQKDPDEPGLGDWTLYMIDEKGSVRFAVTDAKGNYHFTDVVPGQYYIEEVLNYGWRQTFPINGGHEIDIAPGQAVAALDFGNSRVTSDYCLLPSNSVIQNVLGEQIQLQVFIDDSSTLQARAAENASEDVQVEVEFQGLPSGVMGANVDGPEIFEILGPNPFSVEAGSLTTLEFKVHSPVSFTEGYAGPGLFAATITNLATGESFGCTANVWPAHPYFIQLPSFLELLTPLLPGETAFFNFEYETAGLIPGADIPGFTADNGVTDTVTISYTFSAKNEGLEDGLPGIVLNGLPPGNRVQGVITVPMAITSTLDVQVGFAENLPLGPSHIILELDIGADGTVDAVSSAVIPPPIAPPVTPPQDNTLYLPFIVR